NFARTMLLPHLKGQIAFGAVANQTALSANHVKDKFGFAQAATDANKILGRDDLGESKASGQPGPGVIEPAEAVLIATRHSLHAPLVKRALAGHRHIFVEKPLCLSREELAAIDEAHAKSQGTVMVGFNRRFAPASVELKRILESAPGPKCASFRVM